jgi:ribosomal-protein-alanine N-acetyltransferase
MRYTYLDALTSLEEAKKAFERVLRIQEDDDQGTQYVASLGNNEDIGIVDYDVIMKNHEGGIFELGYFIMPEYWGLGFGTEMSQAFIDFLFENYNVHKIVASCNSNNVSSEHIMIKLGMTYEGKLRKVRLKNGIWDDETKYGLLREEWMELSQKQGVKI